MAHRGDLTRLDAFAAGVFLGILFKLALSELFERLGVFGKRNQSLLLLVYGLASRVDHLLLLDDVLGDDFAVLQQVGDVGPVQGRRRLGLGQLSQRLALGLAECFEHQLGVTQERLEGG